MRRTTQGLLLVVLGAVLLRLTVFGDAYLLYVREWMRWPLAACGLLLIVLAMTQTLLLDAAPGEEEHEHGVPSSAWLLFLPPVVVFLVAPPAGGAPLAPGTAVTEVPAGPARASGLSPLPTTDPAPVGVTEFLVRARYDDGLTLQERRVVLTGFVSYDGQGGWYVTRFTIGCCAADGTPSRVRVQDAVAPPRDQWVRVVGSWVEGSGVPGSREPVTVAAQTVEPTPVPASPYE